MYDANLVNVYGLDVGLVGQELKFSVNAAQAGEGIVKVGEELFASSTSVCTLKSFARLFLTYNAKVPKGVLPTS